MLDLIWFSKHVFSFIHFIMFTLCLWRHSLPPPCASVRTLWHTYFQENMLQFCLKNRSEQVVTSCIVFTSKTATCQTMFPGTTLLARCPGKCFVTPFLVTSSRWGQSLHSQKKCISQQCNSFSFGLQFSCNFNAIF